MFSCGIHGITGNEMHFVSVLPEQYVTIDWKCCKLTVNNSDSRIVIVTQILLTGLNAISYCTNWENVMM